MDNQYLREGHINQLSYSIESKTYEFCQINFTSLSYTTINII